LSKNNNTINKPTPLLADFKRYQDKLNNNNFEFKKIKNTNFIKNNQQKENSNVKKGVAKNYFDNSNSFNKLVQIDKLNYSNNIIKSNNPDSVRTLNLKNSNLFIHGFNLSNCQSSLTNKNSNKVLIDNEKYKETNNSSLDIKRPLSSKTNRIIKGCESKLGKEYHLECYKKINYNRTNKASNNENSSSRVKSEGAKINLKNENNIFNPNVDQIIKCLKFIKFPKNYIDYYKIVLDKLQHSKNNKFLISVLEEKRHFVIFFIFDNLKIILISLKLIFNYF